jgi:cytochrome c peroxidase
MLTHMITEQRHGGVCRVDGRRLARLGVLFGWLAMHAAAAELTLTVEPRWNGATLAVPSQTLSNDAQQALRFTRVAALISGVILHRADGSSVRLDGQYGLLDFERGRSASAFTGVPAGEYVGLEFRVGVPPEVNHGDPGVWPAGHPLHPLTNALHWSWQGGYVFLALEGRWASAAGERDGTRAPLERGFLYHVATDARAMAVRFVAQFRIRETTHVALAFDLARVLRAQRFSASDGTESTHSAADDPLAGALAAAVERAWFWLDAKEGVLRAEPPRARAEPSLGRPLAFAVPPGFPQPVLPVDNPLTEEGVSLGRSLFFDPRLSGNGAQSCASCHAPERGFSDVRALSTGARGSVGVRNAMPLVNLAWSERFAWGGGQASVRDQSLAALRNPVEMDGNPPEIIAALAADAEMRRQFRAAFGSEEVTLTRVGLALEQFQLTLVSADSRFDRAMRGEVTLSEAEKRGFELFMTENDPARGRIGADCFHCHGGALFSDFGFKNNGLGARAGADVGLEGVTGKPSDRGKFKTPSLRNVALTGPYMHDGRFATLEEVIAHYDQAVQRSPTLDANLAKRPARGLGLAEADKSALVAFLHTLTDVALTHSSPSQ